MYEIRRIVIEEVEEAMQLALEVFMEFEGPIYGVQGIETFKTDIIFNPVFLDNARKGICPIYAAFDKKKMIGLIGLRSSKKHISLVFVRKEYHHKGIATLLMDKVLSDALKDGLFAQITVNSSPYGKGFYHRYGFIDLDKEKTTDGIIYTPMAFLLDQELKLVHPCHHYVNALNSFKKELDDNPSFDKQIFSNKEFAYLINETDSNPLDNGGFSRFLLVRKEDEQIIGFLNLRHSFIEEKEDSDLWMVIRPCMTHNGYGSKLIALAKQFASLIGMESLQISVPKENNAMRKIVLKNGAFSKGFIMDDEFFSIAIKKIS